jgi:outer membrane protein assembly factor BamB
VAAGTLVAVAVGALVATRPSGDDDGGSGDSASRPWVVPALGNSQKLTTDGEVVCSTTVDSILWCASGETGETTFTIAHDDISNSPELVDGIVLMGLGLNSHGEFLAYSLDGEELWRSDVSVEPDAKMAVVGDTVLAVDRLTVNIERELVAVDLSTGQERWRTFTTHNREDPWLLSADVHTDGRYVYVTVETYDPDVVTDRRDDEPTFVIAIDPASGAEVWRAQLAAPSDGIVSFASLDDGALTAVVVDGGDGHGEMLVVDAATGQRRWQVPLTSPRYAGTSMAHIDGVTVLADGEETRGYSNDGTELWAVPSPQIARSPSFDHPGDLVVDSGRLWSVGYDVYEFDPADGTSVLLAEGVSATDVAVVGDHLVIAGIQQLEAIAIT